MTKDSDLDHYHGSATDLIQNNGNNEFVTMQIAGQLFGISVHMVQDVLAPQKISFIPLAPPEVAGSLNLRGRIVTAIDIRVLLGLPPLEDRTECRSIVIGYKEDLYSFIVDKVGDVLSIPLTSLSHNPENLSPSWQNVSMGVYPMKDTLLVILDVEKLLHMIVGDDNEDEMSM